MTAAKPSLDVFAIEPCDGPDGFAWEEPTEESASMANYDHLGGENPLDYVQALYA